VATNCMPSYRPLAPRVAQKVPGVRMRSSRHRCRGTRLQIQAPCLTSHPRTAGEIGPPRLPVWQVPGLQGT
jgi:hypothetical protein